MENNSSLMVNLPLSGSDSVAEVIITVFQRLCEELESKELNLLWDCFYEDITECVTNGCSMHLTRLLFLLVSTLQIDNGLKISDYQPMLELVRLLVRTFIIPSNIVVAEDHLSEIVDKVLQLMLCILDGLHISNDMSTISSLSSQWAPAFELRNPSAMNSLIETSPEEVIFLMLMFNERLQVDMQSSSFLVGASEEGVSRICSFLQEALLYWTGVINDIVHKDLPSVPSCEVKLPMLWGIIGCCSHMLGIQADPSLLMGLVDALDQLLMIEAGFPKSTWQSLMGAALGSFHKLGSFKKSGVEETNKFLHLAKRYRSSSQVLFSVAELLDSMHGSTIQENNGHMKFHPELKAEKAVDAFDMFSENLSHPDKGIRVSTLRILCHYEPLNGESNVQPVEKKMQTEVSPTSYAEIQRNNVLHILFSIEDTPLSISTSRKVILSISKIQMDLSAARICEAYIPVLLNGIIGIFHNRFSYLWDPAIECLSVLISKHVGLVWDRLVSYLEQCQSVFLTTHDLSEGINIEVCGKTSGMC
ncbi:hypothetical protein CK203_029213 [Vitis vinifera]|uniref:Uncharacterized protein n=1 Tax=Vitis vinifera TaxID=29760 RepID=A0A438ISW1_VITVI|nr:hypothetical protein CK203_029213 [Vitis vinifera]